MTDKVIIAIYTAMVMSAGYLTANDIGLTNTKSDVKSSPTQRGRMHNSIRAFSSGNRGYSYGK